MSKPILPPQVARDFIRDMRAYFAEKNAVKRDAIVAHQAWLLNQHVAKKVKTHEVKEMFLRMRDHA